jgi:hypothetical protein
MLRLLPFAGTTSTTLFQIAGSAAAGVTDSAIDHIRDALRGLKYGLVSIVVQDGVVIQIDRTERRRLR